MDFHNIKLDGRAKHVLSFLPIDFFRLLLHDNKLYDMAHNSILYRYVDEYFELTSTPTMRTPYKEFHQRIAWILQ